MKLLINICVLFVCFVSQISKLIGVVQINRHGARTPLKYREETEAMFFNSGLGQLTINGLRQHELLGRWIGERYMYNTNGDFNILKEDHDPNQIHIRSSPIQRTIF